MCCSTKHGSAQLVQYGSFSKSTPAGQNLNYWRLVTQQDSPRALSFKDSCSEVTRGTDTRKLLEIHISLLPWQRYINSCEFCLTDQKAHSWGPLQHQLSLLEVKSPACWWSTIKAALEVTYPLEHNFIPHLQWHTDTTWKRSSPAKSADKDLELGSFNRFIFFTKKVPL